jgi:hypothetical protein
MPSPARAGGAPTGEGFRCVRSTFEIILGSPKKRCQAPGNVHLISAPCQTFPR